MCDRVRVGMDFFAMRRQRSGRRLFDRLHHGADARPIDRCFDRIDRVAMLPCCIAQVDVAEAILLPFLADSLADMHALVLARHAQRLLERVADACRRAAGTEQQ